LLVMDDRTEARAQLYEFAVVQLASKDRELQMLAIAFHRLEDLAQPLRVADIVRHHVSLAHHSNPSSRSERGILTDLAEQAPPEQPCLHLENAAIADSISEHWVSDELIHPSLVREK